MSLTTAARLTHKLVEAFQQWRQRDLSSLEVVSLVLDGRSLGAEWTPARKRRSWPISTRAFTKAVPC